eukprot:gene3649-4987_t
MPDFNLLGVWGKMRNNYEYADKYALAIIFTCNSNKYSQAYSERLIKLFDQYEEDNFAIIGINSNDDSQSPEDTMEMMIKAAYHYKLHERNFLYVKDDTQEVAKTFGASYNPEVFLFNSKRELVYKGAIDDAWENETVVTQAYLEDAVEYCLDGIDVDFPEVPVTFGEPIIWKPGNEPEYAKMKS